MILGQLIGEIRKLDPSKNIMWLIISTMVILFASYTYMYPKYVEKQNTDIKYAESFKIISQNQVALMNSIEKQVTLDQVDKVFKENIKINNEHLISSIVPAFEKYVVKQNKFVIDNFEELQTGNENVKKLIKTTLDNINIEYEFLNDVYEQEEPVGIVVDDMSDVEFINYHTRGGGISSDGFPAPHVDLDMDLDAENIKEKKKSLIGSLFGKKEKKAKKKDKELPSDKKVARTTVEIGF